MPNTVKVGIFVVGALALLALFILRIEDLELFSGAAQEVEVAFDSVAGLDDKASVRVAGVRVGQINRVDFYASHEGLHLLYEQARRLEKRQQTAEALESYHQALLAAPDEPLILTGLTYHAGVSGWTEATSVVTLQPTTQGRFLVRLDTDEKVSGCRERSWFFRDYSGPGAELMFTLLLEAAVESKKVQLFLTGRCDLDGYSEFSEARIFP